MNQLSSQRINPIPSKAIETAAVFFMNLKKEPEVEEFESGCAFSFATGGIGFN
ncbi:hypothetical protein [Methylosarcina fibrata]|uniref:hypothetical protein n=1 Tax=Methylosarcina fibrata TaxID=105972 RepID=UPI00035E4790|nr:hypothetical protein [Methylosarcina fibrata]